jgi:outer membrane lipoprotein carrier protein
MRGVIVLSLLILLNSLEAVEATTLLEYLTSRFQKISAVRGTFRQTVHIRDMDSENTYTGEFILKRPDRLRWRYLEGSDDVLYINGRDAYLYQPSENQVFIYPAEGIRRGAPMLLCLWDTKGLRREFSINEKNDLIILKPKGRASPFKWLTIYVSKKGFPIRALSFEDNYGNRTDIEFMDTEINPTIDNSIFQFIPPEGVTVIREEGG